MELFNGTQLVKQLLVNQPWRLQELVVGDKLVHDLSLHPSGLEREREHRGFKVVRSKEMFEEEEIG